MRPDASPSKSVPAHDDVWTVGAIAVLAFICADIAHEVIGHGVGFLLAGGRSGLLTTTRLISLDPPLNDLPGRVFDLGGPAGNLACAGLSWRALRMRRQVGPDVRLLLWLAMAFSLFWGFGYLVSCGVLGHGDWVALIRGSSPPWLWRTILAVIGLVLYRRAMTLVASELHRVVPASDAHRRRRLHALILTSYVAGGLIACAGAVLDPRGRAEVWNSGALTGFGSALGLFGALRLGARSADTPGSSGDVVGRNRGWILAAAVASAFYILILGPGVQVSV
jgi:hypothetical protein